MGMRIHKILGYGIHGKTHGIDRNQLWNRLYEETVEGEVVELMDVEIEKARAEERQGYLTLSFQGSVWNERFKTKYPKHFHDIVQYAEFPDSDDGWWVIMPPTDFKSWFRHDNSIDYYEATIADQMETVIREINSPLYPYSSWMDKHTGEVLKHFHPRFDENAHAVPCVPEVIKIVAEHLGMPDWKLFRPVIIQWWS